MIKLLYITNAMNGSGGLERVLSVKASYLAEKLNYEIHILTLNNGYVKPFYGFSNKITFHDISVLGNPVRYARSYFSGIKDTILDVNPDCIVVCDDGLKAFFLPTLLGTRGRDEQSGSKSVPIIYERHVSKAIEIGKGFGIWRLMMAKTKMLFMDLLASTFTKFIILTKGNAKEWNSKNLQIIPNPLPFFPDERAELINKKVIAVGKQSYQKGYDRLLKSWQKVNASHPDWILEIYGKLDPSQKLEPLAKLLGVENTVRFYEPQYAIEDHYLDSSIYVMSSRFEGFGMVLIEAMACGVPCVSFDCPHGPSDIINDNRDGFLVKNGDTDALANQLNVLIEDANLRILMGKNAKENAKRFLPSAIMQQWDELFKSVVQ